MDAFLDWLANTNTSEISFLMAMICSGIAYWGIYLSRHLKSQLSQGLQLDERTNFETEAYKSLNSQKTNYVNDKGVDKVSNEIGAALSLTKIYISFFVQRAAQKPPSNICRLAKR